MAAVIETPAATPATPAAPAAATPAPTPTPAPAATPAPAPTPGATPPVAAVAPVTYTLTLPPGGVVDDSDVQAITALATAKQWTNEQAQAALAEYNDSLVQQSAAFRAELDAHPEIGGTKFPVAQEHAQRVLDKFLPATAPEGAAFRQALNKSGYGNYAPLMLLLSRIGKAMAEDRPIAAVPAAQTPAERISTADALYGATTPSTPKQ